VHGTHLGLPCTQPPAQGWLRWDRNTRLHVAQAKALQILPGHNFFLLLCWRTSGARDAFTSSLHSTTTISVVVATEGPQLPDSTGKQNFLILCSRKSSSRNAFRSLLHSTRTHTKLYGGRQLAEGSKIQIETIGIGGKGGTLYQTVRGQKHLHQC